MKNTIKEKIGSIKNAVAARFSKIERTGQERPPAKVSASKNKKKKRRIIIVVSAAVLIFIAGTLIWGRNAGAEGPSLAYDDTTVLAYTDFSNSISATGTVESAESTLVYSTLSYVVESVYAEAGDYVEEGQLLAKLDDQNIADQIESQEASLSASSAGSAQTVKTAQDNYDQYQDALEKGLNSSLNSAQTQVTTAYENYTKAVKTYERYRDALNAGENTTLLSQEASRANARSALEAAEYTCDEAQDAVDSTYNSWRRAREALTDLESEKQAVLADDPNADVTALNANIAAAQNEVTAKRNAYDAAVSQLNNAERNWNNAENSYELARAQYNAAVTTIDHTLADYADAVDSAEQAYQNALTNLEAVRLSADNQLQSYANSLSSAKINANNSSAQVSLRQLRVTLNSTHITAPVSGTVTAVYATVGSSGSGLLFVIENVKELVVETAVKEYDIGSVAAGMPVTIKSNATGSDIYEGTVLTIAPTSRKTAKGTTDTSGEVEFAAKVKVTTPDTRLRIGMSVRLNYIIEQQHDVLSVPYDAVYTNQAAEQCILILEEQPTGAYRIKELAVTPELENDLAIAISGSGVSAGLRVINEPDGYKPLLGREIALTNRTAPNTMPFPMR